MIRTFIQISSLFLTLEAALFLAKGNLGLSARAIAELASAKWDFNADLISNLSQQRADTWIGVLLLLIAFALQIVNAMWPMRWSDFTVHKGATVYAVVISIVIGFGAFYLSKQVARNTAADVEMIFDQRMNGADQSSQGNNDTD